MRKNSKKLHEKVKVLGWVGQVLDGSTSWVMAYMSEMGHCGALDFGLPKSSHTTLSGWQFLVKSVILNSIRIL